MGRPTNPIRRRGTDSERFIIRSAGMTIDDISRELSGADSATRKRIRQLLIRHWKAGLIVGSGQPTKFASNSILEWICRYFPDIKTQLSIDRPEHAVAFAQLAAHTLKFSFGSIAPAMPSTIDDCHHRIIELERENAALREFKSITEEKERRKRVDGGSQGGRGKEK